MPTRTLNNVTFHYQDRGRGGGGAIVLLHGFPLDSRMWESQLEALSDRYRVIAPDLRGFGKSTSSEPFSMQSLADDVHALLKELGATPCVLGGFSMGGYVALAYAKKYPSDLRGLALIDTRAEGDTNDGRENRNKMIQLAREKGASGVAEQMLPKMLAEATKQKKPEVVSNARSIMDSQPPLAIEHALAAMRDRPDVTKDLPSIAVPTLIVVGEQDAITPLGVAESMNKAIRNPTQTVIRAAGHLSPIEQPEDVTTALRRFAETVSMR
jgi:3-oxoadipate enol-lactonase